MAWNLERLTRGLRAPQPNGPVQAGGGELRRVAGMETDIRDETKMGQHRMLCPRLRGPETCGFIARTAHEPAIVRAERDVKHGRCVPGQGSDLLASGPRPHAHGAIRMRRGNPGSVLRERDVIDPLSRLTCLEDPRHRVFGMRESKQPGRAIFAARGETVAVRGEGDRRHR